MFSRTNFSQLDRPVLACRPGTVKTAIDHAFLGRRGLFKKLGVFSAALVRFFYQSPKYFLGSLVLPIQ